MDQTQTERRTRRLALLAAAREDAQCVAMSEKRIKELTAVLDRSAAVIKVTPRLAPLFAPHTAGIEAKIAELKRQADEARTSSTAKRKELEDMAEIESRRRASAGWAPSN
jgi:hypothetical protein